MTYQIIDAKSRKQIAWGLTLAEAGRFVRMRAGLLFCAWRRSELVELKGARCGRPFG